MYMEVEDSIREMDTGKIHYIMDIQDRDSGCCTVVHAYIQQYHTVHTDRQTDRRQTGHFTEY